LTQPSAVINLHGTEHSYVAARCENGHLQARGQFTFKDDTFLSGVFISPCQVRR
jgi:hypothetical protein